LWCCSCLTLKHGEDVAAAADVIATEFVTDIVRGGAMFIIIIIIIIIIITEGAATGDIGVTIIAMEEMSHKNSRFQM
jgi:Na+/proline symporter